jgi:hypothetical protein
MSALKCFFNVHKWVTIEQQEDKNARGDTVGKFYIQQCQLCGKLRAEHIRFY